MKVFSLVLALLLGVTVFAQKKHHNKHERPKFTTQQRIELRLKSLTVALDLTNRQIRRIEPIVTEMVEYRNNKKAERTTKREHAKPSTDEIFERKMKCLDREADLNKRMKSILDKDQYWAWKQIHHKHKEKMKKHRGHHEKRGEGRGDRPRPKGQTL